MFKGEFFILKNGFYHPSSVCQQTSTRTEGKSQIIRDLGDRDVHKHETFC